MEYNCGVGELHLYTCVENPAEDGTEMYSHLLIMRIVQMGQAIELYIHHRLTDLMLLSLCFKLNSINSFLCLL